MWKSLILSLGKPLFSALVVVAISRGKARVERSTHMSDGEKALANQVIDQLMIDLTNEMNGTPDKPAAPTA